MKALVFIKCNIKKLFKNELIINRFHWDFEEGLSSALCECFPNAKLKYCFFHYGQIIFRKIRSTGNNGLNINNKFEVSKKAEKLFLMLKYLCFIEPKYAIIVYNKIKEEVEIENFMIPYIKYFEDNFIKGRDKDSWNYYNMYSNRTNNCCEGYNSKLNEYFKVKPHIFKLIIKLKEEESIIIKKFTQSEFNLL